MDLLFTLLAVQGALGAFDVLYHHELGERLPWRPSARGELALHGLRNALYAAIFLGLAWAEWRGAWSLAFAAVLVVEIVLTLWDFVVEDRTRALPASERVTHALLAINYGAILAFLLPVLAGWAAAPRAIVAADHGAWSWLLTFFACGVALWAVRDLARASRRVAPRNAAGPLVASALPQRRSVLVTGGTGFVGRRLVAGLVEAGHAVTVLTRDKRRAADLPSPLTLVEDLDALDAGTRFDAIVHLAGAGVAERRWTPARKRALIASRTAITAGLLRFVARAAQPPTVLVNASAVGFYDPYRDEPQDETAPSGTAFTSAQCRAVEAAARAGERLGLRVVQLRIGIVLDRDGGALAKMLPAFDLGLGGPIGGGRQWLSWIHRDDLVALIAHAIADRTMTGAVNAVAPVPVRQRDFAHALGRALRRPALLPLPGFALALALGDMAREVLLAGPRVEPRAALARSFAFAYPQLEDALAAIFDRPRPPAPADWLTAGSGKCDSAGWRNAARAS